MQEHAAGLATTAGRSRYFVERLFKSKSLIAPFHFAAKALGKEKKGGSLTTHILQVFSPFELAIMLSLVYLMRRAKTLCDPDEFKYLADPIYENSLVGLAAGRIIPAIGGGMGLIEGTMRHLALSTFLKHDVKGFKEYRRERKRLADGWRPDLEAERWGCSSIQIASVFLQVLGFGVHRSNAYINAYRSNLDVGTTEEISVARDIRMATLWRESLISTGNKPEIAIPGKYYPTMNDLSQVITIILNAKKDPSICHWLERGKDDLSDVRDSSEDSSLTTGGADADALADEAALAMEELDN